MNTKNNQAKHTIAILADLMSDKLDDMKRIAPLTDKAKRLHELCNELTPLIESMLTEVYGVEQIMTSTYLQEIGAKIDTVIRKNYNPIVK